MDFWQEIKRSKVKFLSLDNINGSEMIADILMSISSAEHKWIKQRQREGYAEHKKAGRKFGSPERMKNPKLRAKAL